ncbi:unnamed protein product, partial [Staurois parvus]
MSVRPHQFPPVSECPPQSSYKSLISTITITRKTNSSIYTIYWIFCKCYNFHVNQLIYTYW